MTAAFRTQWQNHMLAPGYLLLSLPSSYPLQQIYKFRFSSPSSSSKLTKTPIHSSRRNPKTSKKPETRTMETLIPDLPEEIALECLIRVPYQTFPLLRQVSRHWKSTVESPFYHLLRRSSFSSHPLIIFSQSQPPKDSINFPSNKHSFSLPPFRLTALNPISNNFSFLPPIQTLTRGLPLFSGLASSGTNLILAGGWDPDTFSPSSDIYIFSFLTGNWRRGRPMPGPRRSFFACAASPDGRVYIAGGHDEEKNALRSAMVYDVAGDDWQQLPEMAEERDECAGVFDAGANVFRVIGGYCTAMQGRFGGSAEGFDVGEGRWGDVEAGAVEERECAGTWADGGDGRMYGFGRGRRSGVVVVVVKEGEEGWREAGEVPEDVRIGCKMVGCGGGMLVVVGAGIGGGPQAAYLMEMREGEAAEWRRLDMPLEFSGCVHSACCIEI